MEYGQFYLYSGVDIYGDNFDIIEVVTLASSAGIAERDGFIVVSSPHQNNFDMRRASRYGRSGRRLTSMTGRRPSRHRFRSARLA
jgi:hypothetical protein